MNQDRLLELLIKKKSGNITLPEQAELSELLKRAPERGIEEKILDHYFSGSIRVESVSEEFKKRSAEKLVKLIQTASRQEEKSHRLYRIWRFAAVAAMLIIISGIVLYFISQRPLSALPESPNVVNTGKGSKSEMLLPDGTRVLINSDSRLSYSKSFGDKIREVYLDGEAYFDVVKNASKPFLVHTKNMTIKVIGTAFNVKAYPGSNNSETTLIRGLVEVTLLKDSMKKIVLRPNEKLSITDKKEQNPANNRLFQPVAQRPAIIITDIKKPLNDSIAEEIQWIKNRLVFDNMKLREVAEELSRWYNVNIQIKDRELKEKEFSGTFEGESINDVMEALKLTGGFHFQVDKNNITITP